MNESEETSSRVEKILETDSGLSDVINSVSKNASNKDFSYDITITIGDEDIHAKKDVLQSNSTFFSKILQGNNAACEAITLTELGLSYKAVKEVIDLLHNDDVNELLLNTHKNDLFHVFKAAQVLKIHRVVEILKEKFGDLKRYKVPTAVGKNYENLEVDSGSKKGNMVNINDRITSVLPDEISEIQSPTEITNEKKMTCELKGVSKGQKKHKIPSNTLKFLKSLKKKDGGKNSIVEINVENCNLVTSKSQGMSSNINQAHSPCSLNNESHSESNIKSKAIDNEATGNIDNKDIASDEKQLDNTELKDCLIKGEYIVDSSSKSCENSEKDVSSSKDFINMHIFKKKSSSPTRDISNKAVSKKDNCEKVVVASINTDSKLKNKINPVMVRRRKKGEPTERSVLFKYSQHNEKGWYICPRENCKFRSRHSKNVYTHDKTHTGERKYQCFECGKTFILKKNFRLHQAMHRDIRPFSCSQCDKKFRSTANLERHMLIHTGERPFKCEEEGCVMAFRDKANLRKHTALKHRGERPYVCDAKGCDYVAYDQTALLRHSVKHKDLKDRQTEVCPTCGKTLYGMRSLQSHMKLHSGRKEKCPLCDYTTVFKQALQAHTMRKHSVDLEGNLAERKYKCGICAFSTFWEHELKFHNTKHGGYKPFKCPICTYSTVLKGSLQKHMRLHTGEQPFACLLCGKAYTNQSGLARHHRSHTGFKPHTCKVCHKKYADLKTLRVHQFTHFEVKPFICTLCSYTCTKKEVLVAHFKRVHGEGNVPDHFKPKPLNRVIMRVTSGQTADEIVHNIAPPGRGERYMILDEKSNNDKFMVIRDDSMANEEEADIKPLEQSPYIGLDGDNVFAIVSQTEERTETTLDKVASASANDSDKSTEQERSKQQLKVMKIATAPRSSPAKSRTVYGVTSQLQEGEEENSQLHLQMLALAADKPEKNTPAILQFINTNDNSASNKNKHLSSPIQIQSMQQPLTVSGQLANVAGLGHNFIIVTGNEASILKTLELKGQENQLVAIPITANASSNNAMGTVVPNLDMDQSVDSGANVLELPQLMLDSSVVGADFSSQELELANVLAAVKSAAGTSSTNQALEVATSNTSSDTMVTDSASSAVTISIADSLMQLTNHPLLLSSSGEQLDSTASKEQQQDVVQQHSEHGVEEAISYPYGEDMQTYLEKNAHDTSLTKDDSIEIFEGTS